MNKEDYFFRNGCTVCKKGHISFDEVNFLYKCDNCGAFAYAHRVTSEYAKKFEPYQYLASKEVNKLREMVSGIFNLVWTTRIEVLMKEGVSKQSIINIIYPYDIRKIRFMGELHYIKVVDSDKEKGICSVYSITGNIFLDGVSREQLIPVSNKAKTYIWLAENLAITPSDCQIGYLSEEQLRDAYDICTKELINARREASKSFI